MSGESYVERCADEALRHWWWLVRWGLVAPPGLRGRVRRAAVVVGARLAAWEFRARLAVGLVIAFVLGGP